MDIISAENIWYTLNRCWINCYIGPSDKFTIDIGAGFASEEFRMNTRLIGTKVKVVPTELHHGIGMVEYRYCELRRLYIIFK